MLSLRSDREWGWLLVQGLQASISCSYQVPLPLPIPRDSLLSQYNAGAAYFPLAVVSLRFLHFGLLLLLTFLIRWLYLSVFTCLMPISVPVPPPLPTLRSTSQPAKYPLAWTPRHPHLPFPIATRDERPLIPQQGISAAFAFLCSWPFSLLRFCSYGWSFTFILSCPACHLCFIVLL